MAPVCLLWHGWLPSLSTAGERDPWAASLGQLADRSLEQVLVAYPVDHSDLWAAPDFWRVVALGALSLLVLVFIFLPPTWLCMVLFGRRRGMMFGWIGVVHPCRFRASSRRLSVLNSGCDFGFKGLLAGHLGIDNLNVVRSICRLLDCGSLSERLPLVKDGDLFEVEGHATEADVDQGRVRLEDRLGNIEADSAADLGRRHQPEKVMDVRRVLLNARELWYRFMIAVSQVSVNHDGRADTALTSNARLILGFVLTLLCFPAFLVFLDGPWFRYMVGVLLGPMLLAGLFVSACCVDSLLAWPLCIGLLGWSPVAQREVTRPVRAHRLVSISSVTVSEGIEILQGCRFISSLVRALGKLPGGLGRFLPCAVCSHMSRLRHLEWNQWSHGQTSRPLETCHHECLKAVCGVLGYPAGAAAELLDGSLKLRYCTTSFTKRFLPGWAGKRDGVITSRLVDDGCDVTMRSS